MRLAAITRLVWELSGHADVPRQSPIASDVWPLPFFFWTAAGLIRLARQGMVELEQARAAAAQEEARGLAEEVAKARRELLQCPGRRCGRHLTDR